MQIQELRRLLLTFLPENEVLSGEPMRLHTTFRIGGPADLYVRPAGEEELSRTLALCRREEVPVFILGNGSNLLVSDEGFRGVAVEIGREMGGISVEGERIRAGAGASLAAVAREALSASLEGLAFAAGIPGSLGGAAVMNAGAYGGEMKDVLESVRLLFPDGSSRQMTPKELHLGYRYSDIPALGAVVTEAALRLAPGDPAAIRARMEELRLRRQEKQPLELPSAGSTFKRPAGDYAGRLIEAAGLRGFAIGGAMVSEKHCGFIVNRGGARAWDVAALIAEIQKRVFAISGVFLEPEVRFVGNIPEVEDCLFPEM